MSWPKAVINYGGTRFRATVWGFNPKSATRTGAPGFIAIRFTSTELDDEGLWQHINVVLPVADIVSINWECAQAWPGLAAMLPPDKVWSDGYGANIKQAIMSGTFRTTGSL